MYRIKRKVIYIILFVGVLLLLGHWGKVETYYSRDVTVVLVRGNLVTSEDAQGHLWRFEGQGFEIGQKVQLKMSDNHTSNIYDDTILEVK